MSHSYNPDEIEQDGDILSTEDWIIERLSLDEIAGLAAADEQTIKALTKGRKTERKRRERLIEAHYIAAYYGQPAVSLRLLAATGSKSWYWDGSDLANTTDGSTLPCPISGELVN